jgi:hypothetical protein
MSIQILKYLSIEQRNGLRVLQQQVIDLGEAWGWDPDVRISAELPPDVTLNALRDNLYPEYAAIFRSILWQAG